MYSPLASTAQWASLLPLSLSITPYCKGKPLHLMIPLLRHPKMMQHLQSFHLHQLQQGGEQISFGSSLQYHQFEYPLSRK